MLIRPFVRVRVRVRACISVFKEPRGLDAEGGPAPEPAEQGAPRAEAGADQQPHRLHPKGSVQAVGGPDAGAGGTALCARLGRREAR